MKELGLTSYTVDKSVFYRGRTMYALYTDDSILAGPDKKEINHIIEDLKKAKLVLTVEGDLQDFLGVNIERQGYGDINLMQPHLTDQIITDLHLSDEKVSIRDTPATLSKVLKRHSGPEPYDGSFD